jgi:heme A synthase
MDITQTITSGSRPIWLTGAAAALAGSVATELYGLAARAVGIPMEAGSIGADTPDPVTVGMFAMGTVICTFWGTVLAMLLGRFAKNPSRTFVWAAVVLTVLSFTTPVGAGATAASTKVMLCAAHVLAAAIIIPMLARRLSAADR